MCQFNARGLDSDLDYFPPVSRQVQVTYNAIN